MREHAPPWRRLARAPPMSPSPLRPPVVHPACQRLR
uniref:Uncharacterized protein n=1 Tax=Arundo donax TaxID=35708 RepID=A0A0A9BLA1_ARUDO